MKKSVAQSVATPSFLPPPLKTLEDHFDTADPHLWSQSLTPTDPFHKPLPGLIYQSGNVEFRLPHDCPGDLKNEAQVQLDLIPVLRGDFDVQVDLTVTGWSDNGGDWVAVLHVYGWELPQDWPIDYGQPSGFNAGIGRALALPGPSFHFTHTGSNPGAFDGPIQSGDTWRLGIKRTGANLTATITGLAAQDTIVQDLGSAVQPQDTALQLSLWGWKLPMGGIHDAVVQFDNFKINSGYLIWRWSLPKPVIMINGEKEPKVARLQPELAYLAVAEFNGCASGGENTNTKWEWDLDNDGTYETQGAIVSQAYRNAGPHKVALKVTNEANLWAEKKVTFIFNTRPTAVSDRVQTTPGMPVTIPVLDNDWDTDGDPLTIVSADMIEYPQTKVRRGKVTINRGGTITYTPDGIRTGQDAFTYTISDGKGGLATALVRVTIKKPRPLHFNYNRQLFSLHKQMVINVLAHAVAPGVKGLTVKEISHPAHGTVKKHSNNSIVYQPEAGYTGKDTFTYTIADHRGDTLTGKVNVKVT